LDSSFSIEINGTMDVSNDTKVSIINCTLSDGKISSDNFSYRVDGINPFLEESSDLFGDTISFNNEEYYRFNSDLWKVQIRYFTLKLIIFFEIIIRSTNLNLVSYLALFINFDELPEKISGQVVPGS
jgi:hypothetical protein